jgi:low temperature requirement protein LtrA
MAETPTAWFRPPRLRTPSDEEDRRATAFELFFDLVFVAAVAQVATALSHQPTLTGLARFAFLYSVIAWAWGGFTFYANRFEDEDVVYRLLEALAMLTIAAFAVSVHSVMRGGHGSAALALAYAANRLCLIALYARARHYATTAGRRLIDRYLLGLSLGATLWLVSIAVPGPWRYWLWGLGFAAELATPVFAWRALGAPSINVGHITDRYGGFFIIVLGESVVAVVAGIAGTSFTAASATVAAAGFAIALCLWWIYFDLADTSVVGRGTLGLVYVYAHFPLLGGVAAAAAGIKIAITDADLASLPSGARWLMCGGLACYLLSLALLHFAAEWTTPRDRAFVGRLVTSAVIVALAALGGALSPVLFVILLAGVFVAQLVLEILTPPLGAASVWAPGAALVSREDRIASRAIAPA